MRVVDPGHEYELDSLDGVCVQRLVFVKREGPHYPGNVGHHAGTITQEVLRALIDRAVYVNGQIPCPETELALGHLKSALYLMEVRAARVHGRILTADVDSVVAGVNVCRGCGHVSCSGNCHRSLSR